MTLSVDLYYTMRSPYCYFTTPQLMDLVKRYDLEIKVKPVYPLAITQPEIFDNPNPLRTKYFRRDVQRTAQRLGIPLFPPRPDPIQQNMETMEILPDQPYIQRLTHLAQVATEMGRGLPFVAHVSRLIRGSNIDGWDQGNHLAEAVAKAGLNLSDMEPILDQEGERLEAAVKQNREEQLAAGHWGAPLFDYNGEIFFGRDRVEDLVWFLKLNGLEARVR